MDLFLYFFNTINDMMVSWIEYPHVMFLLENIVEILGASFKY